MKVLEVQMLDSRRLFSSYQRRQILVAANYRCEVCAVLLDGEWHAHHRVAWSDVKRRCGSNVVQRIVNHLQHEIEKVLR